MKRKEIVEDYFTFSKPQRRSVIFAIGIILICLTIRFGYSYFFSTKIIPADTAFLQEAEHLSQPDTTQKSYQYSRPTYKNDDAYKEPYKDYPSKTFTAKGELFPFDPNTLNTEGWQRLGLRDKTIATIQNYISKGGKFHKPEDIKRIYGLFPDQAERLLPYVRIAAASTEATGTSYVKPDYVKKETSYPAYPSRNIAPATIDINTADTTAFISLPGIGSKLARNIINFREKLGGFYKIEQVGETYGLPDSVFQKLKHRFAINNPQLRKININTADAATLKVNPYIKWNVANAVVQFRSQHGSYTSLEDLKNIVIIDEQMLVRIRPYLTVE